MKIDHLSTFVMECNGFKASLMSTPKLIGDHVHGLPSGSPMPVYPIAALPGCPDHWVRASGSYICPVNNHALWFNWTYNDPLNTAILPSVKGMNPVTGEKLEGFELRSYRRKCPTHGIPFVKGSKRFCEKCNYEWPPQSYICAPNILWWDGFRQPDGTVRQFFFSEDEVRDVASAVIGKENTVPAFGFAFYEPVKRREPPPQNIIRGMGNIVATKIHPMNGIHPMNINYTSKGLIGPKGMTGQTGPQGCGVNYQSGPIVTYDSVKSFFESEEKTSAMDLDCDVAEEKPTKEVAVGAGARIRQDLEPDTLKVRDWQIKPSAVMRLYFVFYEEFKQIVAKGTRDIVGSKEGFLKDLPVG